MRNHPMQSERSSWWPRITTPVVAASAAISSPRSKPIVVLMAMDGFIVTKGAVGVALVAVGHISRSHVGLGERATDESGLAVEGGCTSLIGADAWKRVLLLVPLALPGLPVVCRYPSKKTECE